jgi:hypothetical protein
MLSRMGHAFGGGAVGTVIEWRSIRMRRRFALWLAQRQQRAMGRSSRMGSPSSSADRVCGQTSVNSRVVETLDSKRTGM